MVQIRHAAGFRLLAGQVALRVSATSLSLLLLTLPWGPHWPLTALGITVQFAGLVTTGFNIADLLIATLLTGWLIALWSGQAHFVVRPSWVTGPLIVLVSAAMLATVPALDRQVAWTFAVRTLCLTGCYFYVRSRPLQPERAILLLMPGLIVTAALAIAQAVHQDPLGLTWLGEPQMYRLTPGTATVLAGGHLILRPYGLLPHANVLGGLLAAAVPLAAYLLYSPSKPAGSRHANDGHHLQVGLGVVALVLLTVGVALSFSRSAWVGLAAAALYCLWRRGARGLLSRRTLRVIALVSLILVPLLALQWDVVAARIYPRERREVLSIQQRLFLLDLTLRVIAWRPLTGVGGNNLVMAEALFRPKDVGSTTGILPVHNTYLLEEAELGPLGGVAWLALMLAPVSGWWLGAAGIRRRRKRCIRGRAPPAQVTHRDDVHPFPHAHKQRLRMLAGAALVVVAVAGLFDFYIMVNEPVALLWTISLALFAQSADREPQTGRNALPS